MQAHKVCKCASKCASDGPPGTPGGPFPCAEWQWGALGTRADLTLVMAPTGRLGCAGSLG